MDNLRALQLTELDILKELLVLFKKNHISYYALGGTVLGAVRHKGFIPWDDDIDIGVPREDYERLQDVCSQLPPHLKFISYTVDPSYPYYIARVIDERIIVRSDRTETYQYTGAWVDIFPLDGMPYYKIPRVLHSARILFDRMLFNFSRFSDVVNTKRTTRPLHERIIIRFAKVTRIYRLVSRQFGYNRLDKTLKKVPYKTSHYNINALGTYKLREMFPKKVFGRGVLYPFEDIMIRGPKNYNAYLTQMYGDWKTPADKMHHSIVSIEKNDSV